jgi:hypothetical protein
MTESRKINGLVLIFAPEERAAADLIERASRESLEVLQRRWALEPPEHCQIFVMSSWRQFLSESTPSYLKVLLALTYPIWVRRVNSLWRYAGGWTQRFGRRIAVGVKTPAELAKSDTRFGERLFVPGDPVERKVMHITCHELTHASTAQLRLPLWLNEGLAMRAVDHYFGRPTVRMDTLELLGGEKSHGPGSYRGLDLKAEERILVQISRGYWLTRYLEECHEALLGGWLHKRSRRRHIDTALAQALVVPPDQLWHSVDTMLLANFAAQQA